MAKRTTKDEGPKWYTATIEPEAKEPSHPSSRTTEVRAANEQEVKERLANDGWKWKRITITEGKCIPVLPLSKDPEAERYHADLEAMLGKSIPPRYNTGPFPVGYRATPEVKDTDARKSWAKYLEEWSHGLSVSALPQYLDVDMGGTVYLPARWVQDPEQWDRCTGIVHATVKQWRARRAHMAEHHKGERSAEARELRRDDLAAVKSMDALEGWTFPAFVERLNLGRNPSPLDVPHPGLLDIATGYMVPTMHPDHEHLKVEFWRQLLTAWGGPVNTRADVVRSMLDHHHHHGGKAKVFGDLVKSTATCLRSMSGTRYQRPEHWDAFATELEG